MAFIRINDSRITQLQLADVQLTNRRLTGRRLLSLRLFARSRAGLFAKDFAALAVRIAFAILLGALLYSAATSMAVADEFAAAPRVLQSLASIRATAEDYVRANSSGNSGNGSSIVVTATELDTRLQLTQCPEPLNAFTLNSAPIAARTTIGVRCTAQATAANAEWTVYVPVAIESEIDVLVLHNSMPRDAHLAVADLETQRRRVPGFGSAYITNAALLRDQHLKRGIPAGAVVTADMLTRDLLVKRGQQVSLVFDTGGLAVQAQGLALADGGTADRIRVQNLSSLKVVEGVIESGNLVRVGM